MAKLDQIEIDDTLYEVVPEIAPLFSTTKAYAAGECVIKDAVLYRFKTAHAAGAWIGTDAEAIEVGKELTDLKQELQEFPNGNYPNMTAGNADQLVSTVTSDDDTPYNFRTTAGSVDVGDRAYVDAIVGGTVALNQLVPITASSTADVINNGDGSFTVASGVDNYYLLTNAFSPVIGHKYLAMLQGGIDSTLYIRIETVSGDALSIKANYIVNVSTEIKTVIYIRYRNIAQNTKVIPQFIDLTQMLGATIADYIYSLEQATAGSGVAWLKAHFPEFFNSGYKEYNPGELVSVSGLSAHKTVGFNQFDKATATNNAYIRAATGETVTGYNEFFCSDYIHILPNTVYYSNADTNGRMGNHVFFDADLNAIGWNATTDNTFTTPQNACYMRVNCIKEKVTADELCINLSWDGEKDGQYEPYVEHTYALDSSLTLRGIPKLDAQNSLYFDGDRYLPDGTVQRRYGVVDLGSLTWEKVSTTDDNYRFRAVYSDVGGNANTDAANMRCTKYIAITGNETYSNPKVGIAGYVSGGYIFVYDPNYLDAATFKTAMSGEYLVYEKANASTETATPYNPVEIVNDFGTEEFITTSLVPVGHETRYAPNLRAKLEMAPESPDGDGLYIVQQSSGENTYIPLASSATIQDILDRLTALENA